MSGNLFECMYFDEEQTNWGSITHNFVMEQHDERKEGNNLQKFIKKVHAAKIEAEIKMRRELDKRICMVKLEKLT